MKILAENGNKPQFTPLFAVILVLITHDAITVVKGLIEISRVKTSAELCTIDILCNVGSEYRDRLEIV